MNKFFFEIFEVVMKIKILLFIILILLPGSRMFVQEIPDCMCPPLSYPKTGQLINQDSSLVFDTCGVWYPSADCDSAFWNNVNSIHFDSAMIRVYAKKSWDVKFDVPAIPLDSVGYDTLLYVTYDAIDSINYPNIKHGFKQLEIDYGTFRLRKIRPDVTIGKLSQYFVLYFDNYVPMGEVWYTIDTMEHVYCEFQGWPKVTQENVVEDENTKDFKISYDASMQNITIQPKNFIKIEKIEIFSLLGTLMYSDKSLTFLNDNNFRINISNYPNGIYIIVINEQIYKLNIVR